MFDHILFAPRRASQALQSKWAIPVGHNGTGRSPVGGSGRCPVGGAHLASPSHWLALHQVNHGLIRTINLNLSKY